MAIGEEHDDATNSADMGRRRMLVKLGLAAGAIYAAPVLLQLDKAHASGASGGSGSGGRGRRRGWGSASYGRGADRRREPNGSDGTR